MGFGVVFKGKFHGKDVTIKKAKEVDRSEMLEERDKEVVVLVKFGCDQIVFQPLVLHPQPRDDGDGARAVRVARRLRHKEVGANREGQNKANARHCEGAGVPAREPGSPLGRQARLRPCILTRRGADRQREADELQVDPERRPADDDHEVHNGDWEPTNMAPEVVNNPKLKKIVDVFSFSVILIECFKWGEACPWALFMFPWQIVAFVQSGNPRAVRDEQ